MRQQRADGCFGASPSLEPYDHSLSLLAVLRAGECGLAQPETLPLSAALEQLIHQPVPARFRADPLLARWNHSAVQIAAGMNLPGASAALPHFAAAANSEGTGQDAAYNGSPRSHCPHGAFIPLGIKSRGLAQSGSAGFRPRSDQDCYHME